MNYFSIQEILDAGITNADILRNNVRNDENNDMVEAPDWLMFNGHPIHNIFISGNSFIGFDQTSSSTAQIQINRRDAVSLYVYYEEGTLFYLLKFIKIRWSGFSQYNSSAVSAKLTYDVIIFETGEIFINFIDIPTSYNTGETKIIGAQDYIFTFSSEQTKVSFYPLENEGEYEGPSYEILNIKKPYVEKYLLLAEDMLFTVQDGLVQVVQGANIPFNIDTDLSSQLFIDAGFDDPPSEEIIHNFDKVKILFWNSIDDFDNYAKLKSKINGIPPSQQIVSNKIDMNHYSIFGLSSVISEIEGEVTVEFSIDGKETWVGFNRSTLMWEQGFYMTSRDLALLSQEILMELYELSKEIFIKVDIKDTSGSVNLIQLNFINSDATIQNEEQEV